MLKTKVRLDFPEASLAPRWVEIGQLLPITDPEIAYDGQLFASNWAVSELSEFKKVQKIIENRKGHIADTGVPATNEAPAANPSNVVEDDGDEIHQEEPGEEAPMYVAKIKRDTFIAVMRFDSQGPIDGAYEVEKLRGKRLRLYDATSSIVKKQKLKTDKNDPWVQRLIKVFTIRFKVGSDL